MPTPNANTNADGNADARGSTIALPGLRPGELKRFAQIFDTYISLTMCILGSSDLAARQERSQHNFIFFYPYNYSFGELSVIFMMPRGRMRKAAVPPPVEDD